MIDQPLVMTGVPVAALQGVPTGTVTVATFTDPEGADPQSDYSASINWGDGQPSSVGAISYSSSTGIFTVTGSHTFAQSGGFPINVTVSHTSAATNTATTVTAQATVAAPVTSTSLVSSKPSAVYGQQVTFTATVTGSGASDWHGHVLRRSGEPGRRDRQWPGRRGQREVSGVVRHVGTACDRQSVLDHGCLRRRQ